eukprot:12101848-Ditylum_brightwellii.AAC.1
MDELSLSFGHPVKSLSIHFPLPGLGYCVFKNVHQVVLHQFHLGFPLSLGGNYSRRSFISLTHATK